MYYQKEWSPIWGELESHHDAPDLNRLADVRNACECFYEIGKLAGVDRHNVLVDKAVHEAIDEVRRQFRERKT